MQPLVGGLFLSMAVPDVSSQIISSRGPLKFASGNFTVKAQLETLMFRLLSIKIVSQSECIAAVIAGVRLRMGLVMTA